MTVQEIIDELRSEADEASAIIENELHNSNGDKYNMWAQLGRFSGLRDALNKLEYELGE